MDAVTKAENTEYYNEEYKVKKAKNISDTSVLHGKMSKGKMIGIVVGSAIGMSVVFIGTVILYNMYG